MPREEKWRLVLLSLILLFISMAATTVAVVLLYGTALEERRQDLIVTARSQARLIESVARHDRKYSQMIQDEEPDYDAFEASLAQVIGAHRVFEGFGKTGEFTLAQRINHQIVFLFRHHVDRVVRPQPISFESKLAEPMRRALNGESGSMAGLDYKGETVIAAYEPVAELNLGIVAKVNLAEVRQPFIYIAFIVFALTLFMIVGGVLLLKRAIAPLFANLQSTTKDLDTEIEQHQRALTALQESEARFVQIADAAEDVFWLIDCQDSENPKILYVNQAFATIWQRTAEEVLDDPHVWFDPIHPEDLERIKAVYSHFLRGEWTFEDEFRLCLKGEEIRHIRVKGELIRNEAGSIVRAAGLAHDITLIKEAELSVQKANLELETRVEERTAELNRTIRLMAGRENRMADLKLEITQIKEELKAARGEV